jgi:FtsH-binding integral membrane protein
MRCAVPRRKRVSLESRAKAHDIADIGRAYGGALKWSLDIMANWSDPRGPATAFNPAAGVGAEQYNEGLRGHMLRVYNYMASGVLLTGIVAMLFARGGADSIAADIFFNGGPLAWIIKLSPLAFVLVLSFGINRLSTGMAQLLFWAFAAVMGMSLSTIFLVYTQGSIAQAFFSTAVAFLGLSLFGYTTKKDLSGMGVFLLMGLFGLIGATLLNVFFFKSGGFDLVISIVGVLIFAGLTAFDTQMIKNQYAQVAGTEFAGKAVIMAALNLYLDFINMFLFLLRIFGNRN